MYDGHISGGEFYHKLNIYAHNMLQIVPKYNMICNIGATFDASHAAELKIMPRAIRKIFNMKTYEYDFPLKHPKYIINDKNYEKQVDRILARNTPIRSLFRKFEVFYLLLKHKGLNILLLKIGKLISKKKKIET